LSKIVCLLKKSCDILSDGVKFGAIMFLYRSLKWNKCQLEGHVRLELLVRREAWGVLVPTLVNLLVTETLFRRELWGVLVPTLANLLVTETLFRGELWGVFSSYHCKFTGCRNTVSRGVMGSFSSYPFKFSILKA
jgi:hypothetical protein